MILFKDRPTVDVVVILMTALVAFTVFTGALGTIVAKILHPELDVSGSAELIGSVITTIVGALVGFIGGRAVGRSEANGAPK